MKGLKGLDLDKILEEGAKDVNECADCGWKYNRNFKVRFNLPFEVPEGFKITFTFTCPECGAVKDVEFDVWSFVNKRERRRKTT